MRLPELVEGLTDVAELPDVEVGDLAYSTSAVGPGSLFFCVPGFRTDGHAFASEAVERGAVALVCERHVDIGGGGGDVPQVIVPDVRRFMAPVAARFFGNPSARLTVVGVTGTNGKTTTTHLVRGIFEAAGIPCGLLGTVQSIVGGRAEEVERTTPEALDLQRTMRRMLDGGDRALAMEVSSHATTLHRTDAIELDRAVFTNLTPEHLDFHGDMEDYYESKRIAFFPTAGRPPERAVVNVDDEYGRRLATELVEAGREVDTFSLERPACYRAFELRSDSRGAHFKVADLHGDPYEIVTPLVGRFNVANALAAVAATRSLGVELEAVRPALAAAGQVPGRFERIDAGQDFAVIVDYAHTPDSLANVLETARAITPGDRRVHVVFGCGGDRDRGKRPQMGRIATALADRVVVTSDNPRNEEPAAVVDEILAGMEEAAGSPAVEVDRRRAIELALGGAEAGDTVVIAGKGHEQGQELKQGKKIPFDDREVARQALAGLAAAHG